MNADDRKRTVKTQSNGNGRAAGEVPRRSDRPMLDASAAPRPAHGGEGDEAGNNLMAIVNDRLSGRWVPAIALGVALAALFAVLGYQVTGVRYDAVGIIQVSPKISPLMRDTPETVLSPHYAHQIETEARMVTSNPRILERAIQSLDLTQTPWESVPQAMRSLQTNLSARTERNTQLIYVSYRADSPLLAQNVTNAVLRSYDEIRGSVERDEHARRVNELRAERARFNNQWRQKNAEMLDFIASTGFAMEDFRGAIASREDLIQDARMEIRKSEQALEVITARGADDTGVEAGRDNLLSERELEAFDQDLAELGQSRRRARLAFANAQERLRPEHDDYVARRNQRDLLERLYAQRFDIVLEEFIASGQLTGAMVNSPDDLRLRIEQLRREVEEHRAVAQQMMKWQATLGEMRAELAQIEQWRTDIDHRITGLNIEADQISAGRIQVAAMAQRPSRPSQDRRQALAAIGAVGGFGAGLGAFFLLGTVDRRVYAARQLTGSGTAGRMRGRLVDPSHRLLGVLPALPQRVGDVEAASVAAHCVHQIRNHIEATRAASGSIVLVVSSPYQGDGKTSLVMSLGASYAATGCRVLLVDCDLVGKNMTTHSMMSGQPGLREALRRANANGSALSVPETFPLAPGANLSVLPVGNDATFGPEMIRRENLEAIFEQLRDQFDVILVDTGPLFGSIETLPAAAAADGVILTMQRGRRHSRLKECVEELEAIDAHYLGLVLNHARISDCDRYVSKSRISAVVTAHEGAASNGASKSKRPPDRPAAPRASRNVLLRAMQVTSRIES